jgi:hypothetical protein
MSYEVMRLGVRGNSLATRLFCWKKLGGNEVFLQ